MPKTVVSCHARCAAYRAFDCPAAVVSGVLCDVLLLFCRRTTHKAEGPRLFADGRRSLRGPNRHRYLVLGPCPSALIPISGAWQCCR